MTIHEIMKDFIEFVINPIHVYIRNYGRETDHIPRIPDDILIEYVRKVFDDVSNIGSDLDRNAMEIEVENTAAELTKSLFWHYRDYLCDATYYKMSTKLYHSCYDFVSYLLHKIYEEDK